jgi:prepilin-type N-terminal cleavage/methylation domain-containing protein
MTTPRSNIFRLARGHARGFTLAELLVVMGLLALLAVLTAFSAKRIAADSRLSSATNAVIGALSNARAYAIQNNTMVMVAFRPVWDPNHADTPQQIEIVFAEWTGLSQHIADGPPGEAVFEDNCDFFRPIPKLLPRRLPIGVKVAGPQYAKTDLNDPTPEDVDHLWFVQPELSKSSLAAPSEAADSVVGVMFAADGTAVTRNSKTSSNKAFCDFNSDGALMYDKVSYSIVQISNPAVTSYGLQGNLVAAGPFNQRYHDDEPAITLVPYLAVFDEREARQRYDVTQWDDPEVRTADLSNYINQFANRLHFNRYTGVVMRQQES